MKRGLSFDDITIVPKYSDISSRKECSVLASIGRKRLSIPIISSPMDTVTGVEMAVAMKNMGGAGVIHRFMSVLEQCEAAESAMDRAVGDGVNGAIGVAIGVTGDFLKRAEYMGSYVDFLMIDVAHGHHILVKEAVKKIRAILPEVYIVAGAVSTREGALFLAECDIDCIKVGQGNGSLCETRIRTGCGVPQVTAIMESIEAPEPIIADGGIRTPGDFAKAIALGADMVMIGSLFSGTKEAPGIIKKIGKWPNEQLFKEYRGSASLSSKLDRGEEGKNVEGNAKLVPYKGKVKRIVSDLMDGLRSSMSYVGAKTVSDYWDKVEIMEVTNAAIHESKPHLLN